MTQTDPRLHAPDLINSSIHDLQCDTLKSVTSQEYIADSDSPSYISLLTMLAAAECCSVLGSWAPL